ncbi:hypothetical protein BLNAU_14150 [Blattamonas nauphoetae]|uniref:Uncharacterized protein n=1 Tax=Blattamonas nauphoetae TaxID=2049346 RepID=A0ABQ9XGZ0_9EUKA|nr:hypothetical protein BLNAU_14150 [Blattamonas nauphoetae]
MEPKKEPLPPRRRILQTQHLEPPSSPSPVSSTLLRPTSSRKAVSKYVQSSSSLPSLPPSSQIPPNEHMTDISKPTAIARRSISTQKVNPKQPFDTTTLHQTIQTLELEVKRLKEEHSQIKPKDTVQLSRSTQTPIIERSRPSQASLPVSPKKQQGESIGYDLTDVFAFRASLGTIFRGR